MLDVIIVGGSYAGTAAALQLGRARRQVLIIDAGERRNRTAHAAHGFLGQDGVPPGVIAERGRAEALAYPSVSYREGRVTHARVIPGGFSVDVDGGQLSAKRLILATGVVDDLPLIPGIQERWGQSVFHCPYCHGYELNRGRIGVLGTNPMSVHQANLVNEWGEPGATVLFLNGAFEPDAEQLAELAARKIHIERERVLGLDGHSPNVSVQLESGRREHFAGLFVAPHMRLAVPFAEQLGCELEATPFGTYYKTDSMKETTVPGAFACGDAGLPMGSVSFAVADGVRAGIGAHASLVFRNN